MCFVLIKKKGARIYLSALITMSESVNERGSLSSELGDVEISSSDDMELDDPRFRFFLSYLNIVFGTTPTAFQKRMLIRDCSIV